MEYIEEFIVLKDAGFDSEEVYYSGLDEVEAHRSYQRIKEGTRGIFKAYIKRDLVFNVPFIVSYTILKRVK